MRKSWAMDRITKLIYSFTSLVLILLCLPLELRFPCLGLKSLGMFETVAVMTELATEHTSLLQSPVDHPPVLGCVISRGRDTYLLGLGRYLWTINGSDEVTHATPAEDGLDWLPRVPGCSRLIRGQAQAQAQARNTQYSTTGTSRGHEPSCGDTWYKVRRRPPDLPDLCHLPLGVTAAPSQRPTR